MTLRNGEFGEQFVQVTGLGRCVRGGRSSKQDGERGPGPSAVSPRAAAALPVPLQKSMQASFLDLGDVEQRPLAMEDRCNATARPFGWRFARDDLL
jgi:hypothetical protein